MPMGGNYLVSERKPIPLSFRPKGEICKSNNLNGPKISRYARNDSFGRFRSDTNYQFRNEGFSSGFVTNNYALTNLLPESCFTSFFISRMSKVLETTEVGSFVMRIISSMSLGLLDRSENIFFS